jgi:peptidoglycan/LPS O-acetylase OafA/YrhL
MPQSDHSRVLITPHTGLRGVAALCVFITHLGSEQQITLGFNQRFLWPFYWSDFAVDLFFMLSGFILNWVYVTSPVALLDWGRYLRARCARILPLYYLTMIPFLPPTITTLRIQGWGYDHGLLGAKLLGNLTMLAGFSGPDRWSWRYNAPSWSISVEFFAYLVLMPLLILRLRRSGGRIPYVILFVSAMGALLCYADFRHVLWGWNWSQFARGLFCFPLGFVLCSLFRRYRDHGSRLAGPTCLAALLVMALALYGWVPRILVLCCFPLIVYFSAFNSGIFSRVMNTKPLQWLGERSYSIYLWHTPIMYVWFIPRIASIDGAMTVPSAWLGVSNMALIIVSVMVLSELSYRLFEDPVRRLLNGRGWSLPSPLNQRISH